MISKKQITQDKGFNEMKQFQIPRGKIKERKP